MFVLAGACQGWHHVDDITQFAVVRAFGRQDSPWWLSVLFDYPPSGAQNADTPHMNNNVDLFPIFTLLPMAVVVALVFWVNSEMRKLRESFQQQSPVIKPDTKGLETVMKQLRLMADDQANSETLKKTNLDVAGVLSSQDRIQLARLVVLMGILDEKVNVAAIHAESVAEDLAASHLRANETEGPSGAAADAAFKTNSSI